MDKAYQIEEKGDITVVTFIYPPGCLDFYDAFMEVLRQGGFARYRLWDLSCGFDLSSPEMQDLGLYSASIIDGSPAMVGVIAPDDLSYGLAKMMGGYSPSKSIDYRVFRSRVEALKWMSANGIT